MAIALVPVTKGSNVSDEDWYIHVDGVSRGYLYRVADGYAVGIDVKGKIEHRSIEADKEAALAFATTYVEGVVLEVYKSASGQYGGRILRAGIEDGRVAGCSSREDVECQALEAGIEFSRVEVLDAAPPVQ